jgi:glycosyltransferase involved in cell wall biosynthesis
MSKRDNNQHGKLNLRACDWVESKPPGLPIGAEPMGRATQNGALECPSAKPPAVIIVGPPWPRSGTARVIQNQIDYYRYRGFRTLFVTVPFYRDYMPDNKIWDELKEGINDFGADHTAIAHLSPRRYKIAKYKASISHGFRGTALDWTIAVGRSARLPADTIRSFRDLPVALLHVNHVYTLGFALDLRRQLAASGARMPIILETHDIQSDLLREKGELNPWTHRPDRVERLVESEIGQLRKVDVLVHLSVDDFRFFQAQIPSKPHILALPTIDQRFISAVNGAPAPADKIDVLFVGQFHNANLRGIEWFLEHVWPRIADRRYNLKIVGLIDILVRQKLPQLYEAFRPCFIGQVTDLAPFYRAARCVIAPMVSGSGTSIKTIEALAMGKPFIGTSKAFRGMPMERIRRAGIQEYDDPQAFADAIVQALSTEQSGALSRAAYDGVFSQSAAFAARDKALRLATDAHSPNSLRERLGFA